MKPFHFHTNGWIVILSLMMVGCSPTIPMPGVTATTQPSTKKATVTIPVVVVTSTPAPALTETPTTDPSLTPAIQSTVNAVEKPILYSKSDTNCRKFPSNQSQIIGYFLEGRQSEIVGVDASGTWYLIPNQSKSPKPPCWVWSGSTEVIGDSKLIPFVSAVVK